MERVEWVLGRVICVEMRGLRRWSRWQQRSLESGRGHCYCLFIVLITRLPPFVRFVGVTIAPLSREEGSLTALCSIFELEQQRLFAIFCIIKTMVSRLYRWLGLRY